MSVAASLSPAADLTTRLVGEHGLALRQKVLLWIFCFSFAFDFKGPTGSTIFQYVFTVVALLSGCLLWFQDGGTKSPPNTRRMVAGVSMIFILAYGSIILNNYFNFSDIPLERSLRVMFPYAMLVVSIGVMSSFAKKGTRLSVLLPPLIVAGLMSMIWRQVYASVVIGVDLNEQRYQAISPAFMFLVPYAMAQVSLRTKQSILNWVIIGLTLISIYISVTRIFMFAYAMTFLGVAVALFVQGRLFQPTLVVKRAIVGIVALVGLVGAIAVATQIRPNIIESWQERLSVTPNLQDATRTPDISAYLRLAATKGMIDGVTEEPFTIIMGKGFGAGYMHDRTHEGIISRAVPFPVSEMWAIVDVGVVYLFFAGGIVIGGAILGVFFATIFVTIRAMVNLKRLGQTEMPFVWAATSFLAMIWCLSLMPTSYVFQERMSAQLVGVMIGIGMVIADRTNRILREQRSERMATIRASAVQVSPQTA